MIHGLFGKDLEKRATPPDNSTKDDKDRAKQSMLNLQKKIQNEVIPEVAANFRKYKDIQSECKRLGIGGKGSREELNKKLVKKITDDRFGDEVRRLKEQMKKYVPENDPESEALRDIFQCNKDFETNLSQLGGDYDY